MTRQEHLERVTRQLDHITAKYASKINRNGIVGITRIDWSERGNVRELGIGILPFQRRAICVDGRRLTPDVTSQPTLVVVSEDGIATLPYAENVIRHPLRRRIERYLTVLDGREG